MAETEIRASELREGDLFTEMGIDDEPLRADSLDWKGDTLIVNDERALDCDTVIVRHYIHVPSSEVNADRDEGAACDENLADAVTGGPDEVTCPDCLRDFGWIFPGHAPCANCGRDADENGVDSDGSRRCDDTDPAHRFHAPEGRDEMRVHRFPTYPVTDAAGSRPGL